MKRLFWSYTGNSSTLYGGCMDPWHCPTLWGMYGLSQYTVLHCEGLCRPHKQHCSVLCTVPRYSVLSTFEGVYVLYSYILFHTAKGCIDPLYYTYISTLFHTVNCGIVPDVTMTYIRGWMQMVYHHMIYSPETDKQVWQWDHGTWWLDNIDIFTRMDNGHLKVHYRILIVLTLCTMGPLCHTWPFFPSSSRSMMLLSPPLLAVSCLSCCLPGGPGPPSSPPPGLTPFSLCSRQHPVPLSDTGIDPVHYTYTYILFHTVRGCMYITPYTMRGIWINIYVYKMFNINQYILYFFILSVGVFWNVQHREGACVGRYDHEIMTKIS